MRVPSRRNHLTPFRLQDARFSLLMSRNWLSRNQGPPSRRYEGAATAVNDSAIDSDSQGDHNPSTSWCHAGPSTPCSASTLTTRDEPFASATSPPAKSSCVRRPYGTPQPKRQFSVTRALFSATRDNLPLHVLTGEPGSRFEGAGIGTVWTEESGWVGRCI